MKWIHIFTAEEKLRHEIVVDLIPEDVTVLERHLVLSSMTRFRQTMTTDIDHAGFHVSNGNKESRVVVWGAERFAHMNINLEEYLMDTYGVKCEYKPLDINI